MTLIEIKWRQSFDLAIHVCCEMRVTTYYPLPILALVSIAPDIVTYISYIKRADRKVRFPNCWGYRERF
jgi:hypothetical protein